MKTRTNLKPVALVVPALLACPSLVEATWQPWDADDGVGFLAEAGVGNWVKAQYARTGYSLTLDRTTKGFLRSGGTFTVFDSPMTGSYVDASWGFTEATYWAAFADVYLDSVNYAHANVTSDY